MLLPIKRFNTDLFLIGHQLYRHFCARDVMLRHDISKQAYLDGLGEDWLSQMSYFE